MCILYVRVCVVHRGLAAGIYATNNPEACHFVADNCKANVIVVENQKQLDKILEVSVAVTETYFCTSQVECRGLPMSVCLHHYQCLPVRLPMSACLEPISLCLSVDVFSSAPPLQVRDRLPHLKAIVQYKGKLSQEYPNVYEVTPLHTPHACTHGRTCTHVYMWLT